MTAAMNLLPDEGTATDLAERLARYVDSRQPGWSTRVRGATEQEIVALERSLFREGAPLRFPASFRSTLRLFGHDDDGLYRRLEYTYGTVRTVAQLGELYADLAEEDGHSFGPEQPPILGSNLGDYLVFELRGWDGLREPVVHFEDSENVFAKSWEALVFQHAALELDLRTAEHASWTSATPEALVRALGCTPGERVTRSIEAVDTFAREHGLQSAWFSDRTHRILVGPDVSIWVGLLHAIKIYVSGPEQIAHELAKELAAVFGAYPPKTTDKMR